MSSKLLIVLTILYYYGGFLDAATIRQSENESDHSHVALNFLVPGKPGVQVNAVLYNEDVINSEKDKTGVDLHQHCHTHNNYSWNFILAAVKEIEFTSLPDNKIIAKIDVNKEADIEDLVVKGNNISGLEFKKLPLYIDVSDDNNEKRQITKCPECKKNGPIKNLHWRDWTGSIPPDAIVGDYNVFNGTKIPVFLAQGLMQTKNSGLIPTGLLRDSKHASLPYEGVHNVTKNIKVLCGDQQDVAWVSWQKASHFNKERDYVEAGFERTFPLYFGRARHRGQYVFGKVVLRDHSTYFAYGNSEYVITSFDVLCYRRALTIDQFVKD